MSDAREIWMAAGAELARDPTREVACPACGAGPLAVTDAPRPDGAGLERRMTCPGCGASETILITRPRGPAA